MGYIISFLTGFAVAAVIAFIVFACMPDKEERKENAHE